MKIIREINEWLDSLLMKGLIHGAFLVFSCVVSTITVLYGNIVMINVLLHVLCGSEIVLVQDFLITFFIVIIVMVMISIDRFQWYHGK